ncbi:MAG: ATP-binding protein, partial [Phycisphaerae bacterium]
AMDDVIGLEDAKAMVRRRIVYPFSHPEAGKRFERTPGGGVLLYGPPGTGKTMLARAIAGEVDAVFLSARSSDLLTKWVGESEQNLRRLFESARDSGRAVVFLDEVDTLLPCRRGESHVTDRLTQEFLVQMDGLGSSTEGILVIGATNRPWDMDEAALRPGRFGELVYVGLPDGPARAAMLTCRLGRVPVDADVDIDELAQRTEGFSGADLAGLCDRVKDAAFEREVVSGAPQSVRREDFAAALSQGSPSVSPAAMEHFERFGRSGPSAGPAQNKQADPR